MRVRCLASTALVAVLCAGPASAAPPTGVGQQKHVKVPAPAALDVKTPKFHDDAEKYIPIGPPPINDFCEDAIGPLTVPSTTAGTTNGSTFDTVPDDFCGTSITSGGVWYSVIGTGTTMTASTCDDADYDTKISIFCGTCADLTCVAGQDDSPDCGGFTTEIDWCAQLGVEYRILVHGFGVDTGDFNLTITEDGVACDAAVLCDALGGCCLADDSCVVATGAECDALAGAFLGDDVPCELNLSTASYFNTNSGDIPDADPVGLTRTIVLPNTGIVHDLDVSLVINHTWVGDLCVTLEHGGVSVGLIQRPGDDTGIPCHDGAPFGCDADDYDIVLDDEGTVGSIEDACEDGLVSPPAYTPNEALAAFNGMDIGGAWTLTVVDRAAGDPGTLIEWGLHFNEIARLCVDCDDNLIPDDIETLPENLPGDAVGQDACWDAMLIGPGFVYIDNTFGATSDGDPFCGNLIGVFDVWFRYRPTWTGRAFIEINGPPNHWLLSVYDGCPNGVVPDEIICNDLNPNGVNFHVERGQDYLIRVAAQNFERAPFRMRLLGPETNLNTLDFDGDGVPDVCQCYFDVDGDNDVDINDFYEVLFSFGECGPGPCPADVDGDGQVDQHDAQLVWLAIGSFCP